MPDIDEIDRRIGVFKSDVVRLSVPLMVQKHITYGDAYALDQSAYFELKHKVSELFKLHPTEVLVVGSGKLGFSIVAAKRYRHFGNTSDIDVAIISSNLFDEIWSDVFVYWLSKAYWPSFEDFRRYLFRGWMRPDKLPPERSFARSREWWEFFRELSNSQQFGPYRIRGALYKSWYYLESYQAQCIAECRREIEGDL
jgi:hypothetical protein